MLKLPDTLLSAKQHSESSETTSYQRNRVRALNEPGTTSD